MGNPVELEISWNVQHLEQFTFVVDECKVTHGDVELTFVKEGCYSSLLDSHPVETDDSHTRVVSFKSFKAHGESSATQVNILNNKSGIVQTG